MERQVPAVAETDHVEHAIVGEVAADLLGKPRPHVLCDLLGAPHMGRDLRDRLEDQVKIANGDSLGQQDLEDRQQARIGDLRGAEILDKALVFGIEPVEQPAHVLVGQELGEVRPDHFAQMGEQHRQIVDRLAALPLDLVGEGFRHPQRLHAEGRLDHLVTRHVGLAVLVDQHQHLAEPELAMGNARVVDPDLVALGIDRQIVGELDLGNDEAVLLGKLLADLGHAVGKLGARAQEMDRKVAAERQLDLGGLELLLHRFLGLGLGALVGLGCRLLALPRRLPPRQRIADEGHDTPSSTNGAIGSPGIRASTNIISAAADTARG